MKSTTVEGRAKTKNGVTRLVFSVICILLEVIFIILMFTKLNRYAEAVNLLTRVVGVIVILNMYADGVSMENIIKWADADENLVKAVIAEYKESRA